MEKSYFLILGFCTWTFLLLMLIGVERLRTALQGKAKANDFRPSNEFGPNLSHRIGRAHANCIENLPLLLGVIFYASLTNNLAITNCLSITFLVLRIAQSITHVISISARAVLVRFLLFIAQCTILLYWIIRLWLVY